MHPLDINISNSFSKFDKLGTVQNYIIVFWEVYKHILLFPWRIFSGSKHCSFVGGYPPIDLIFFCKRIPSTDTFLFCQRTCSHRICLKLEDIVWNNSHKSVLYFTLCVKYFTQSLSGKMLYTREYPLPILSTVHQIV